MSGRPIKKGSTDQSTVIRIIDATDGTPEQAVEHDTSGIALWWRREGETLTAITEAALASLDAAHSDGGIEHIDDGYYRLDLPDAAVAAGAGENGVMVGGAVTGMIVIGTYHPLVDYDPNDSVRLGLTALPNAAADAAGGLMISDDGGWDADELYDAIVTDAAGANVAADIIAVKAETALIVADTNELQTDDIPGTLSTIDGKIDTMDTNVDQIETAVITNAAGADIAADIIAVKAETALIVADTNELQTDNIPGTLSTIDGKIDTVDGNVDSILTDTGTTLQGELDAIQAAVITNAAGADIAADIIAVKAETATIVADTEDIQTQIGTAGAGLTDLGGMSDGMKAEVEAEALDALEGVQLDHLVGVTTGVAADGDLSTYCVDGSVMSHVMTAGADTSDYNASTDSLEVGGGGDATEAKQDTIITEVNKIGVIPALDGGAQTIGAAIAKLADDNGGADFDAGTDSLQELRDHIGDGTNLTEAGGDGDQLTAINLPNQTMDITGNLSGSVGSVTGNVGGNVTGSVGSNIELGPAEVNTEVDNAIETYKLDHLVAVADADDVVNDSIIAKMSASDGDWSGFDNSTDSLEAIRDRGDADWSAGAAANPNMILEAEVATVSTQTSFTLATGADFDDAYNDQTIVLYDDSNNDYPSVRVISDYTGATKTVTIDSGGDFTLGTDDSIKIFATAPGSNAPTAAQIVNEWETQSQADPTGFHVNVLEWTGNAVTASGGNPDVNVETQDNIDFGATQKASIETAADASLATYDAPTKAEMDTAHGLLATEAKQDIIDTNVDSILTDTGTTLENRLIAIEADTDVIDDGTSGLVKIASDVAAVLVDTGTTLDGKIDTIDGNVDSILTDTGTTLQAELDGIQADTEDIQSRIPAALVSGRMSSDAVAISGSTDAADKLEASAETILIGTVSHDNTAATTTVFYCDDITEATADHLNGRVIIFVSGDLQYQASSISDYSLEAGEGKFTVVALTEAPADNDTFVIV